MQNNRLIILLSIVSAVLFFTAVLFFGADWDGVVRGGILWDGVGSEEDITPLLEHGSDAVPRQKKG